MAAIRVVALPVVLALRYRSCQSVISTVLSPALYSSTNSSLPKVAPVCTSVIMIDEVDNAGLTVSSATAITGSRHCMEATIRLAITYLFFTRKIVRKVAAKRKRLAEFGRSRYTRAYVTAERKFTKPARSKPPHRRRCGHHYRCYHQPQQSEN